MAAIIERLNKSFFFFLFRLFDWNDSKKYTQTTRNAANFCDFIALSLASFCHFSCSIMNRSTQQIGVLNVYQSLLFSFFIVLMFHVLPFISMYSSITFMIRSDKRLKIGQFTRRAFAKSNKIANRVITTCSAPINHSAQMRPECTMVTRVEYASTEKRKYMPKINKLITQVRNCRQTQLHLREWPSTVRPTDTDSTSKRCVCNGQKDKHATPLPQINKPKKSIWSESGKGDMRRWKRSLSKQVHIERRSTGARVRWTHVPPCVPPCGAATAIPRASSLWGHVCRSRCRYLFLNLDKLFFPRIYFWKGKERK